MIPIIIVGGVASGVFTPAEAGMIAVVYIIVVLLPLMARGHIRRLPRDFVEAAVLYSLPMSAVAAASAVGWLMAYLDAPDIVHRWIEAVSGDNRIVIMYLMVVCSPSPAIFSMACPRSRSSCRSSSRSPSSATSTPSTWACSSS
jgi:TRAP-type C4-dicarboxylate transport system permease large subunit